MKHTDDHVWMFIDHTFLNPNETAEQLYSNYMHNSFVKFAWLIGSTIFSMKMMNIYLTAIAILCAFGCGAAQPSVYKLEPCENSRGYVYIVRNTSRMEPGPDGDPDLWQIVYHIIGSSTELNKDSSYGTATEVCVVIARNPVNNCAKAISLAHDVIATNFRGKTWIQKGDNAFITSEKYIPVVVGIIENLCYRSGLQLQNDIQLYSCI